MSTAPLRANFTNSCPHLSCGERLDSKSNSSNALFCVHCGSGVVRCPACLVANRFFAIYCRACGNALRTEVLGSHPGLKTPDVRFDPIHTIPQSASPARFRLGDNVISLLATQGVIVAALQKGYIALVNEYRTEELARITLPGAIRVSPALQDGLLCIAVNNALMAFDLAAFLEQPNKSSAKPDWTFASAGLITQPIVTNKQVAFVTAQHEGKAILDAVSLEDGRRVWVEPLLFDANQIAPPVLVDQQIVLLTAEGTAYVVNATEGQLVEKVSLGRMPDCRLSPTVVGSRVILADAESNILEIALHENDLLVTTLYGSRARVTAISATEDFIAFGHIAGLTLLNSRGHLLWSNDGLEPIYLSPLIAGRSIFALDDKGNGLLFDELRSTPVEKFKMLSGEITLPPVQTLSKIIAVNTEGELASVGWS
jgi:hypothetical protein